MSSYFKSYDLKSDSGLRNNDSCCQGDVDSLNRGSTWGSHVQYRPFCQICLVILETRCCLLCKINVFYYQTRKCGMWFWFNIHCVALSKSYSLVVISSTILLWHVRFVMGVQRAFKLVCNCLWGRHFFYLSFLAASISRGGFGCSVTGCSRFKTVGTTFLWFWPWSWSRSCILPESSLVSPT